MTVIKQQATNPEDMIRNGLRSVIGNTSWLMLDRLVRLALGVTIGALVARYLGPTQYGELAYAISLVAIFQTIANLGADGIIVRDIAKAPMQGPIILGTAFRLRLFCGVLSWIGAVVSVAVLQPNDLRAMQITGIIAGGLVFQAANTIDLWFQSQGQNRRTVIPKLISYVTANGVKVVLLWLQAPLILFAVALLLDMALAAVGLWISYRKFRCASVWRSDWNHARSLLSQSFPFLLSGLAIMIYMRIDQVMVRQMLGETELGIYAAATALSSMWGFIPLTLSTALAPHVTRAKAESEAAYYQALRQVFRVYAAVALVVVTLVEIFGPLAVSILYGPDYAEAAQVLSIHVLTFIFISLGVAQCMWIVNEGNGRIELLRTVTGVAVSLAGNFLLIPRLGLMGAAMVAVLVQFVSAVGSNVIVAPRMLRMQAMSLLESPIPIRWCFAQAWQVVRRTRGA